MIRSYTNYKNTSKFMKDFIIIFLGNSGSKLLALLYMIMISNRLSQSDYGYIAYIFTLGGFLSSIVSVYHIAVSRYISRDWYNRDLYIENGIVGMLLFLMIIIPFSSIFIKSVEMLLQIIILVLSTSLLFLYLGILRGEKMFKEYSLISLLQNGFKVILLITSMLLGFFSSITAIWIYASMGIFVVLISDIFYRKLKLPKLQLRIFKKMFKYTLPILITSVFYSLMSATGIFILKWDMGDISVGIYKNAQLIIMTYLYIPAAIGVILLPKISETNNPMLIFKYLKKSITYSLFLEVVGFLIFIFIGKFIIISIFGERYSYVYFLVNLLFIGVFMLTIRNLFETFWRALGRTWISAIDIIISGTSILLLTYILVINNGLPGAAYAYDVGCILAVVVNILFYYYYKKRNEFSPSFIHKD